MNPIVSLLTGGSRRVVEALVPLRTLEDVVLPEKTRLTLERALGEVRNHALIFRNWGLGERHTSGRGLTFNFAGPPGTGKTICAEAVANTLGMKLLIVNYAEAESMWIGETPKNIARMFRAASDQRAVLFFDEADAIAMRRSSGNAVAYEREMNTTVSVLLRELEAFNGIVIFATNLAANFDPAFERRIRTHVLFEIPGVEEREKIWQLQLHPTKTPLDADVDFRALAQRFVASGGDIKNAVIKAAAAAASEPGSDLTKCIAQRHSEAAMEEVIAARSIMKQSVFESSAVQAPIVEELRSLVDPRLKLLAGAAFGLAALALLVAFLAIWMAQLR